jgi:serine protease Do
MRIGTSSDLMAGEDVIAIGNAFGYYHTVTKGIISSLHRTVQVSDEQTYRDVIQTNADINPGNSGGPLLNIDGEVIGVNVAVRIGAQGIAFAIPIDQALDIAAGLMSAERLAGVSHGVAGKTQVNDAKPKFIVTAVRKDSPVVNNLQPGDIVTAVGPVTVHRWLDFERAMIGRKPGEQVEVTVIRGGESVPLQVALSASGNTPARPVTLSERAWDVLGLKLEPMPQQAVRTINERYNGGLKVTAVRNDSPAAAQGIRRGDVLVGMLNWETTKLEDVAYILARPEFVATQPVTFYILRGTETLYGHLKVSSSTNR